LKSNDFLFTWKPERWPYEKLRAQIDEFEAGRTIDEPWSCQAHNKIRPGARAYLYKQGDPPRGIFAVAQVVGRAEERNDAKKGEGRYVVPLRFEVLLDPTKRFLATENDLLNLPVPRHRWSTRASGIGLEEEVARVIDDLAAREQSTAASALYSGDGDRSLSPGKRERLAEVYERDQTLVDELKHLYKDHCQICDSMPFNGRFGRIVEGHHIRWLCQGGTDSLDNLMLLCPNHHAAVHAKDPAFDRTTLAFRFGPKIVPIRRNLHLKPA
jgi:hypothetical protein